MICLKSPRSGRGTMKPMPLYALGLNHRTAPLPVREAVAFDPDAQREALDPLRRAAEASELVLVSTCNRSEIYLRGESDQAMEGAQAWLREHARTRSTDLGPHLYRLSDTHVARHAFRVASGLDSLVLGEPQILGQVKRAVALAQERGTLGGPLQRLFQETFSVAKQVRAQTAIGESSVSLAAAAVKLAHQVFGDLSKVRVLFIGAGEMIELAATHFAAHRPAGLVVANRTIERGAALAERLGGMSMALAALPERIAEFDVVVSCTASTLPLVGKGMIERAMRQRRRRPMFIADLAVPRDVEAEVATVPDVFVHTLDSLGQVTQQNAQARERAVEAADRIIETRVAGFGEWLRSRQMVPAIRELRSRADHDREIELARAKKRLERGDDPVEVMEALSRSLANKLLHPAMGAMQRASREDRPELANAVERLFLG